MKHWQKSNPELFVKTVYDHPGPDTNILDCLQIRPTQETRQTFRCADNAGYTVMFSID